MTNTRKAIFDKSAHIHKLLEKSDKKLCDFDHARSTKNAIVRYINDRTKIDKKKINNYLDLKTYEGNMDPYGVGDFLEPMEFMMGKPHPRTNPITAVLFQLRETIQLLRQFDNVEILLPYIQSLDDYGIHLDIDNNGDPNKIETQKFGNSMASDIYEKIDHAVKWRTDEISHRQTVKGDGVVADLSYNWVQPADYSEIATLYHRRKHRNDRRVDAKFEKIIERHEKAHQATEETDRKFC